jgi:isopentenyl phosphate kinase
VIELLVKLGGAVVADDPSEAKANAPRVRALARVLRGAEARGLVLAHGTGRAGKPEATRHGFAHTGRVERERRAIALAIRTALRDLNRRIVALLIEEGLPALAADPEDHLDVADPPRSPSVATLSPWLDDGLVPVFYGDMVRAAGGAWRVLSSDEIMVKLATLLRPRRCVFLTDVDGVMGDDGGGGETLLRELSPANLGRVARRDSDARDVSAGMTGKVRSAVDAARFSGDCRILDGTKPERLAAYLRGEDVIGTRVVSAGVS